ncbi:MAG TPA: thymidine phosphorylase [Vicinamibacterales bacterium]|nr:thymidine phosphorylase [Vicinamibacterales bacterium]
MRAVDVIVRKREGLALTRDEIVFFVDGVTSGSWRDYQASALLMAIVLRGMTAQETSWLTDAMVRSGIRADLSQVPGFKVDKHSTGGVGDKTSLILAPIVAACGLPVPMMSGRGLGHTGGTLDKLESIPGFRVRLSLDEMQAALAKTGCAMIGQTEQIAPADKILYALRDVTGTVESIPLISASIMSKKIAEGIDALVLDVKTGSGAFMKTEADSRRLAESLVSIGNMAGVETLALITDMDAPLGRAVGNANEVIECIEVMRGGGPADLIEVTMALTNRLLVIGRAAAGLAEADRMAREAIASGRALDRFRQMIAFQGGDPRVVDDVSRLPHVEARDLLTAPRDGFIERVDAELVGRAAVALGAGRDRAEDAVDFGVGIFVNAKPGARVRAGDAVFDIRYRDSGRLERARALLADSLVIGDAPPVPRKLIIEEIRKDRKVN